MQQVVGDTRKLARNRHGDCVFHAALCVLGAFRAKNIESICVYQLRSDKDFVYFT